MTADTPPIPVQLAGRPTLGGLVVPWVTARTPDGRYRFGGIDADRHAQAIGQRLCQTCGRPLGRRIVFAMRSEDLVRLLSPEPGMHPVCAHYSAATCPMLAGRMDHYRASAITAALAGLGFVDQGGPASGRAGAPAKPWQLMWASSYWPVADPHTQLPAALVLPEQILRVRPINPAA